MIQLAHDCSVLGIPYDARLFIEPPGNYTLGLLMVCDLVSETNRREQEKADAARNKIG